MTQNSIPQHVAVIMDGNNRWARLRGLEMGDGHIEGEKALRKVAIHAAQLGVRYFTVFAFSSENWQRPKREVDFLMDLFADALENKVSELYEHDIAVRFIGDRLVFSDKVQSQMAAIEQRPLAKPSMTVNVALNYGGKWDLTQAMQKLAEQVQLGQLDPLAISEELIAEKLSLAGQPPVDLCIRTAKEQRISNFLLWDLAYSELFFADQLWPDFDEQAFDQAIHFYQQRERRFGMTSEQIASLS
ncbi:MAG: polyprenyl diphosphate synthase [Pseudomonadota bacterium]|nr:polyprenyl diphosphate synthase [Pseudomonadota bacterium]